MNAWYSQNTRSIYIVALFSILYMQPLGCADSAQSHDLEYSERTLENDQATSDEEYAAGEEGLTDLGMEQPETDYLPADEGLIPPDADCQLLATSQNEEGPVLCLDSLHREDSTQYCDPQRLSDLFKEELDLEVECVDFDLDCYFVCEGWTLPPELQDLDDQRDFIRGDHLDQALAEPPSTSCSLPAREL
jgi:hypothetical protein